MQAWGPSMSHQQRNQVDAIAAHIASTAGLAIEHMSQSYEGSSNQAGTVAVQLAALKAMLASVLCPAPHRAPFLPQALMLFTQVCTLVTVACNDRSSSWSATQALAPPQHILVYCRKWYQVLQ